MGGVAILNGQPLDIIIGAKKMVPAVNEFIENIKNDKSSPELLYKNATTKLPLLITHHKDAGIYDESTHKEKPQ